MDTAEMLRHDAALAAIPARVVELYRPARVYLFGSKARGDGGPDCDYDVLAIVPDDAGAERTQSRRFYENCWDLPRGADVLIWRPSRFEAQAQHVVASFPATVLREGRLLYAA